MWDMESFLCNILLSFPLKHLPGWVLRREFPLPGHTVAACLFTLDQRWLGDMEASRDKRLRVRGLDCTGPSVLAGFPTTFSAFVCPSQFVPPYPPQPQPCPGTGGRLSGPSHLVRGLCHLAHLPEDSAAS